MTLYMLDTNAVSDLVRTPGGRVAAKIREHGLGNVCLSIVVRAEIMFGLEKRNDRPLRERVDGILALIDVVPLDEPADVHYGRLSFALEAAGRPIGSNDLLIAAHALSLGAVPVTDNLREFARVPDLAVENWLRH